VRRLILAALLLVACEDRSYRDIGAEIRVLAERDDQLVARSLERLVRFGRRAVPQIETALHTASARGKLNLVRALDAIAAPDAAPILRHLAVYDPAPEVRGACEAVLRRWAATAGAQAEAARRALARVEAKRGRGEGPVVAGEK
jgi:hypothetical protein